MLIIQFVIGIRIEEYPGLLLIDKCISLLIQCRQLIKNAMVFNYFIVSESEYHYPGPKPRSKETAILMIADSVEAASRTLDEPKPARIRSLVRRLIQDKFESGQLSDSELTMRDLSIMEDAFTQMLIGIFHKRIDYPSKDEEE